MVSHPAETLDGGNPGARRRTYVHAIAHVALEVVQVHQRRFGQVVVRETHVADLDRDDGLRAGRQRSVPNGDRLVISKVARLLIGGEGVSSHVHRQDEVGLLDYLRAVWVVVWELVEKR